MFNRLYPLAALLAAGLAMLGVTGCQTVGQGDTAPRSAAGLEFRTPLEALTISVQISPIGKRIIASCLLRNRSDRPIYYYRLDAFSQNELRYYGRGSDVATLNLQKLAEAKPFLIATTLIAPPARKEAIAIPPGDQAHEQFVLSVTDDFGPGAYGLLTTFQAGFRRDKMTDAPVLKLFNNFGQPTSGTGQ